MQFCPRQEASEQSCQAKQTHMRAVPGEGSATARDTSSLSLDLFSLGVCFLTEFKEDVYKEAGKL